MIASMDGCGVALIWMGRGLLVLNGFSFPACLYGLYLFLSWQIEARQRAAQVVACMRCVPSARLVSGLIISVCALRIATSWAA